MSETARSGPSQEALMGTDAAGVLTLTYGLNATGTATGCPVVGSSYYFQLVWAGTGGKTYTFILPY